MPLKISRILHAGYIFEHDGVQIAFDPIFENPFSRNCYAYPSVAFDRQKIQDLKLSAIFISHFHDDHFSLESLNLLDRKTPIYIYCIFEGLVDLIKQLGFINVQRLRLNCAIAVGPITVTTLRALDADVDSIFHIKTADLNVLNVVDSWIDDEVIAELERVGPWDMILWPFQTMREIEVIAPSRATPPPKDLPPEWLEQLKKLNPRFVVPSSCQFIHESWSWYNQVLFPISYKQFKEQIETALPNTKAVRLNPSISISLNKNSLAHAPSLDWVQPMGDQNVDYEYQADVKPPASKDVAQRFAALTPEQTERVINYCRYEILEKYKTLDFDEDSFFAKPCNWQLSVYDHSGEAYRFYYHLDGNLMKTAQETPPTWATEISIAKFYAALELGESMSSMYIRINDMGASEVDIVEDPLIRCLFNGEPGSYQKAQLNTLSSQLF